ncbi:MAG: choice-of-anchor R domain-containing protein [Candidatus Hodarchaeales archaeon]
MPSVTFDGTEIVNTTYVPRFVKHESMPERALTLLELAREDGAVLVAEKYRTKRIIIAGNIKASSQSSLESSIDDFKELFSRVNKDLVISWAGGSRTYKATCIKHNFNRDYMHLLFAPWTAEFIVPSGIGKGSTQQVYNDSFTADTGNDTVSFSQGSKTPKPYSIEITFTDVPADRKGFSFRCGGKKLIYTQSSNFSDGDKLRINCEDKIVDFKPSGGSFSEVGFYGPFPEFTLGSNTFYIELGEISIEGDVTKGGSGQQVYGDNWKAQGFMIPWKDESIMCIAAHFTTTGTPPNDLVLRIETDNGGKPSGTLADPNAEISTPAGSLPGLGDDYKFYFSSAITLEANTRYWLVAKTTAGDASNCYNWIRYGGDFYNKGNASSTADAGSNWTDDPDNDYNFEIFVGGKRTAGTIQISIVIDYYPYFL